ncbi:MAG: hypothetical protein AAGF48_15275, partial [Pseudomonadota bacterium]
DDLLFTETFALHDLPPSRIQRWKIPVRNGPDIGRNVKFEWFDAPATPSMSSPIVSSSTSAEEPASISESVAPKSKTSGPVAEK